MNELNENIKDLEIKIFKDELKLNREKEIYAIAMLSGVSELEKSYKEEKNIGHSTAAKREAVVSNYVAIKEVKTNIDSIDFSIKTDKIDLRFMEREFKIRLKN